MDITNLLDSEYARKLKMGDISFKDIPKEFRKEVINEMKENDFTEEIEPVG